MRLSSQHAAIQGLVIHGGPQKVHDRAAAHLDRHHPGTRCYARRATTAGCDVECTNGARAVCAVAVEVIWWLPGGDAVGA
jgi:hypothetical protein